MHLGIGLGLLDIASSGFFNFEAAGGHLWQSFPSSAPSAHQLHSFQPTSVDTQLSVAPAPPSNVPTFELLDVDIWIIILAATKWLCGPDTLSSCNRYLSQFNQKLYSAFLKPDAEIPKGIHPRQFILSHPERSTISISIGKSMDEFASMTQDDKKTVLRAFYTSLHVKDMEERVSVVVHELMPNYRSPSPLALKKFMENNKSLTFESIVTLPVDLIRALNYEEVKGFLNRHPSFISHLHTFSMGFISCLVSRTAELHSFLFKGKFDIEKFFNITDKGYEILELKKARTFLEQHPEYLDSFITAGDQIDAEKYVAEVIAQHNRTEAIA